MDGIDGNRLQFCVCYYCKFLIRIPDNLVVSDSDCEVKGFWDAIQPIQRYISVQKCVIITPVFMILFEVPGSIPDRFDVENIPFSVVSGPIVCPAVITPDFHNTGANNLYMALV